MNDAGFFSFLPWCEMGRVEMERLPLNFRIFVIFANNRTIRLSNGYSRPASMGEEEDNQSKEDGISNEYESNNVPSREAGLPV